MTARSPGGLIVRVEHRDDGSWWLMLPDRMEGDDFVAADATGIATYPLVVQPMSVPKRRLIRQGDGTYRLPPGMRHPVRFLIQDSTGRRVRNLYLADDGRIGSAHELGMYTHPTKHFNPLQRQQRRQDKVRQDYPLQADDILNNHISVRQLLARRPFGMHRTRWLAYIIRARHGIVHKGDLPALQEEITVAINEHLWTKTRGHPRKYKMTTNFATTLAPFNLARWQAKADLELDQEPVGIGDRRYID